MFTSYADFEIDVQPRAGDVFPFIVRSPGGEAHGALRPPIGDPIYEAMASRLSALSTDECLLTQIGQMLFGAVFQGKVAEVYARSQGTLGASQGLRIKLIIDPTAHEVAALPWEFLYDPDQGPLALLDVSVVRYIPQPTVIPRLKTRLPLRVLLTSAQTVPGGDVGRELNEVQATLARLGEHVRITLEPHLTTGKLRQRLREGFDVWHFVGYSDLSDDGATGRLYLEGANGGTPVSAAELGILLNRSSVRIVVLDACDSGRLVLDPFRSLAPALVRAQVPAVIAMQFKASEETTDAFAKNFYQALAEGFPLDACVTEGRKGVMSGCGLDRADWGIPVVYTRAPDGMLFDLPPPVAPTICGTIISQATSAGAVAATAGVHAQAGTLLSTPPPLTVKRHEVTPDPPRRQRGFLNREKERQALQAELQPGGGAWLRGPLGCGLSSLLNQAASDVASGALPDGVVCVEGEIGHTGVNDVLQRLFDRFYMTSVPTYVNLGMAQTYLGKLRALFVFDRLPLGYEKLEWLARVVLPNSAVLIAADGEAPNTLLDLPLRGLPGTEAIKLCAGEAELDHAHPELAEVLGRICSALSDLPLPLLLVARLIRLKVSTVEQFAAVLDEMAGRETQLQEHMIGQLVDSSSQQAAPVRADRHDSHEALVRAARLVLEALSDEERTVLESVVVGQPDVQFETLVESTQLPTTTIRSALRRLADLRLVVGNDQRYAVVTFSLRHVLKELLQPRQARHRTAAFFVSAAAQHTGDLAWLGQEAGNILEAIETLLAEGQAAQAGALAKALQPALTLSGLWDGWSYAVDLAAEAARRSGDRALEAWALHERGTRAGLLGDRLTAADTLNRALRLRQQLGDRVGAAATRRNMAYLDLFPPTPPDTSWQRRLRRYRLPIVGGIAGTLLSSIAVAIVLSALGPALGDDQAITMEDTPVAIPVIANDTDWIGTIDPASMQVVATPASGVASADPATGGFTFIPKQDFFGADRFSYQVCNNRQKCASANVAVTVLPVNDLPEAKADVTSTNEDTPVEIDVAANDTDVEDPQLAVEVGGTSEHRGDLTRSSSTVTYKPRVNFNGEDHFTYTAVDTDGGRMPGEVTVMVRPINDAPSFTKGPDQRVEEDGGPQTAEWARDISAGAPDEAAQKLTFEIDNPKPELFAAQPAIDPTGKLTYTPAPNISGDTTITVTLHDNGGTANGGSDTSTPQTLIIIVNPVNDNPDAVDDTATILEDSSANPLDVLANDTATPDTGETLTIVAVGQSKNSNAAIVGGTGLTYTSNTNFQGTDVFTYTIGDGNGGTDTATVTLTVNAVNDAPAFTKGADQVVAEDAGAQTVGSWATAISPGSNESGQTVTFLVTNNNTALFASPPSIASNGTLSYALAENVNGVAVVTVRLRDSGGTANGGVNTSAPQTFTITVNAVNDNPTALNDTLTLSEDSGATAINVLANDIDIDGKIDPGSLRIIDGPQRGKVTPAAGQITYTPSPNDFGDDSFTYLVCDDGGTCSDAATVNITITPMNDNPVLAPGGNAVFSTYTYESYDLCIATSKLLINFVDIDGGDRLTVEPLSSTSVQGGTMVLSDSKIIYTPPAGFLGTDEFRYVVTDGKGGRIEGSVTVKVQFPPADFYLTTQPPCREA